jgi:hypothetical protein
MASEYDVLLVASAFTTGKCELLIICWLVNDGSVSKTPFTFLQFHIKVQTLVG